MLESKNIAVSSGRQTSSYDGCALSHRTLPVKNPPAYPRRITAISVAARAILAQGSASMSSKGQRLPLIFLAGYPDYRRLGGDRDGADAFAYVMSGWFRAREALLDSDLVHRAAGGRGGGAIRIVECPVGAVAVDMGGVEEGDCTGVVRVESG